MNQPVERDRDKFLIPDLRLRVLSLRSDRVLLLDLIVSVQTTSHPEISKAEKKITS